MCNFCCILVFDLVVLLFWAIALVVVCCFRLLGVWWFWTCLDVIVSAC